MMQWVADGGVIEPQFTAEELAEKEATEQKNIQLSKNAEARDFLSEGGKPGETGTGWKVTRHRDQIDKGSETSLTDEQYQALLTERQEARDLVIDIPE